MAEDIISPDCITFRWSFVSPVHIVIVIKSGLDLFGKIEVILPPKLKIHSHVGPGELLEV